jgi:hypothetical protein
MSIKEFPKEKTSAPFALYLFLSRGATVYRIGWKWGMMKL